MPLKIERCSFVLAFEPGGIAKFHGKLIFVQLPLAFVDVLQILRVIRDPWRKLEMHRDKLAKALQRLYPSTVLMPEFVCNFAREILVIDVLLSDRPTYGQNIFRYNG